MLIGSGKADFKKVFTILKQAGYTGAVTIERETSGPNKIEDVKQEKAYPERVLREVMGALRTVRRRIQMERGKLLVAVESTVAGLMVTNSRAAFDYVENSAVRMGPRSR